jgi:uncharacterized membrane protein
MASYEDPEAGTYQSVTSYGAASASSDPNAPTIEPADNIGSADQYDTSVGIPAKYLAPFAYTFSLITALLVILVERKSDYVLFHAYQSALLYILVFLPCTLFDYLVFGQPLFTWIAYVVSSLILMYKAYVDVNRMDGGMKLPCIGALADNAVESCCTGRRVSQVL